MIRSTMPSAVIVSLHGMKIAALLQSWSMMVSMVSYPSDFGSLMMKSIAITSKGSASVFVVIGMRCGFR